MGRKQTRPLNQQLSYEERKTLIKEARGLIAELAEIVKLLGHWPKAVDFALEKILLIVKRIHAENERKETIRKNNK